jgi:hypothetical protein
MSQSASVVHGAWRLPQFVHPSQVPPVVEEMRQTWDPEQTAIDPG